MQTRHVGDTHTTPVQNSTLSIVSSRPLPVTVPVRYSIDALLLTASTWSPMASGCRLVNGPNMKQERWRARDPSDHSSSYSLPVSSCRMTFAENTTEIKSNLRKFLLERIS